MSSQKIKEAVMHLAGTLGKDEVTMIQCIVGSVDVASRTCDCTSIGGESEIKITGAKLQAEVSDGFLLIPKVDSTVFIGYTKRVDPHVLLFSEVDRMLIGIGDSSFEIKNDGSIKINDGSLGGLVKIDSLVNRMNAVEDKLNGLITKYNTHTHTGVQTGGGTSAVTTATETAVDKTVKSDLENTKITHGA
jgi:hypothetical protein